MKEEKKKTDIAESETWKICSNPPVAAFIFALASMIFSEEFMRFVQGRDWARACLWVVCTWFGFFLFWSVVVSFVRVFVEDRCVKMFAKVGKWKTVLVMLSSVILFVIVFYVMRFVMFKE